MSQPTTATDKARAAMNARIDRAMKALAEALRCFGSAKEKAGAAREVQALQARIDVAGRDAGASGMRALAALLKQAEALEPALRQRYYDAFAALRREELRGQVNAALAAALLDIGRLAEPSMTRLLFAEQSALKARMDKAEKLPRAIDAVTAMDEIDDALPALQQRIRAALAVSAWIAGPYRAARHQAEAAIQALRSEPGRRLLRAELDAVDVAKIAALARLDAKAVEAATLPRLRRVVEQARRLAAAGLALDRDLLNAGRQLQALGRLPDLAAWLRQLVLLCKAGCPEARSVDDLERRLGLLGKDIGELAATLRREALRAAAPAH